MIFSQIEEDLKKSFIWAQLFCIFPYKCDRRALVLDKCLACGYVLVSIWGTCFPLLDIYTQLKDGQLNMVMIVKIAIVAWLSFSIAAIPLLHRFNLKSVFGELISLEKDLCRFGLAVKPKRSMWFQIVAMLSMAILATCDIAYSVDEVPVLVIFRIIAGHLRLNTAVAEGYLTMGFIQAAGHVFNLLNASAHRPNRINVNKITVLSDLHSRAVHVCRKINDVFSSYLAMLFLTTLSAVITSSYGILKHIKSKNLSKIPADLYIILIYFALTARIIHVFSETKREAARFRYTLCHHLEKSVDTNSMPFLNYKLKIDSLSFTAKGFVDIHPSILLTILSCAVTYLIILID